MLILSHIHSLWCSIYFTSSVSPDHSGGGPSPTVTHPHLLHLAGSLMQNEALTLYQSVKALFAITSISWTHSVINVHILSPPLPTVNKSEWLLCAAVMISNMECCEFSLWLYSREWVESTGTGKEKTSGVVTVRVVRKEAWCTVGEIDSYLDENEAWCLWGERRAALASKWIEVSQKWCLSESPTIK